MMGWFLAWKTAPQWIRTMIIGSVVLVALAGLMLALSNWVDNIHDEGVALGGSQEREAATGIVIGNIKDANDAKQEIQAELNTGHGNELYAQCLRSARTPTNCERFLSHR